MIPQNFQDYIENEPETKFEKAYVIGGARVIWADYSKLSRDYPFLIEDGSNICHEKINNWILRNCAVLSESQFKNGSFMRETSEIPIIDEINACRPPRYGRALIVEPRDLNGNAIDRILDLKGVGVGTGEYPIFDFHNSGALHVPFAFQELLTQRLIESIFAKLELDVVGVPVYAIIDLGFLMDVPGWNGITMTKKKMKCAVMVRQGHFRPKGNIELADFGSDSQQAQLFIELILRNYGISSSNSGSKLAIFNQDDEICCTYGGKKVDIPSAVDMKTFIRSNSISLPSMYDCINIQATRDSSLNPFKIRLIDFGHYVFRNDFTTTILSLVKDKYLNWGGTISSNDENWVTPDPQVSIGNKLSSSSDINEELAKWFELEPGYLLNGAQKFGLELSMYLEKLDLNPASTKKLLDDFVNLVFTNKFTPHYLSDDVDALKLAMEQ